MQLEKNKIKKKQMKKINWLVLLQIIQTNIKILRF